MKYRVLLMLGLVFVLYGVGIWQKPSNAQMRRASTLSSLGLIVPGNCNGVYAQDGAITTGTSTFTSALAGFTSTAVDAGKPISIEGAGPTQFFGNATIAGGGAGHAIGEEIALTGGTGTTATVIVRAVSGGAITAVAGKAGSLGSYTVVPGNPVTAGDATLTVTWLRDSLVTTIQSVSNSTTAVVAGTASATVTGAGWGYGSDYSTQINAAVAAAPTALPGNGQWCGIASSISIDSLQTLSGQGASGYGRGQSNLLWLGPVGGTMLKADTAAKVHGARLGPFNLMGLGAASFGVSLRGFQHGRADLQVTNVKDWAFKLEEASAGGHDTFFNDFRLVAAVNPPYPAARNAIGIGFPKALVSSGANDVNGNNFYSTTVLHQDGVGIDLDEGYLNNFYLTQLFGTGNTWGVRFGASSVDARQTARNNVFYNLISQANLLSESNTFPAIQNRILPLDKVQYATTATVQGASTLYCVDSLGSEDRCTPHAYDSRYCGNPSLTNTTANYVAMGCAGILVPHNSGKVSITINGAFLNATAGSGVLGTIYYGTGTAPSNGDNIETAGAARTQCGGFPALANTPSGTFQAPFSATCNVAGLVGGATYWYDLGIKAVVGNNASALNVALSANELP